MIYLCKKVYNSLLCLYRVVLLADSCYKFSFVNQYIVECPVFFTTLILSASRTEKFSQYFLPTDIR